MRMTRGLAGSARLGDQGQLPVDAHDGLAPRRPRGSCRRLPPPRPCWWTESARSATSSYSPTRSAPGRPTWMVMQRRTAACWTWGSHRRPTDSPAGGPPTSSAIRDLMGFCGGRCQARLTTSGAGDAVSHATTGQGQRSCPAPATRLSVEASTAPAHREWRALLRSGGLRPTHPPGPRGPEPLTLARQGDGRSPGTGGVRPRTSGTRSLWARIWRCLPVLARRGQVKVSPEISRGSGQGLLVRQGRCTCP
jgi:hypothetical protein